MTISALFGANVADDRGNVMIGIERDTRSKHAMAARLARRGLSRIRTRRAAASPSAARRGAQRTRGSRTNPNFGRRPSAPIRDHPEQSTPTPSAAGIWPRAKAARSAIINPARPARAPTALFQRAAAGSRIPNNVNAVDYRLNDDGTIFTGWGSLSEAPTMTPARTGSTARCTIQTPDETASGDLDGDFQGLPVFVDAAERPHQGEQPVQLGVDAARAALGVRERPFRRLRQLSVTGQAMVTRTKTESSLGLAAANINQWGAGIPFGNQLYRGNKHVYGGRTRFRHPGLAGRRQRNGIADAGDRTNAAYTPNGRYGVKCEAAPRPRCPGSTACPAARTRRRGRSPPRSTTS